jgi:eukaryotic-like serine/threonine-protein kinase
MATGFAERAALRRSLEEAWREITPHLDQALELDGEARERWLEELHSQSPALADRIRAYLVELQQLDARNFLGVTPMSALMATELQGQRFGSYTLDRVIGQGGMGTVWLAHRSDGQFEGQAAVKLLNTPLAGHPSGKRFAREASVLAKLQHPNIAHLLDAGITEGGQPYLVLEYIRGDHIDRYCEGHALSIEQRIALFLDVLSAVAHAHSNLIVHRDLKPSNILVTEHGVVKLLDFGVAALLSDDTDTGFIAPGLTPGYAAPEQLLEQMVTTATDVYALGLVLFVLLAGRHPILAEEGMTAADVVRRKLEIRPPRLSEVMPDDRQARLLRGDLDAIVTKAIHRDPAQRYTTAELLAQDLQRYLALEPVAARPRSFRYLAAKFVRRNRMAVFAGSAATLAIIAAGMFAIWQMIEANRQRNVAEEQATRAESTRDFLEFVLNDAGATGKPFTTSELLIRAEKSIQAQYGAADSPAALEQLINLAVLNAGMGLHQKAQELLETVRRRASRMANGDLRWRSACELGNVYQYTGKVREAHALFAETVSEVKRLAPGSPVLVECLQQESDLQLTEDDIVGGLATARDAVGLAESVFAGSPLRQVGPRVQLAVAYRLAGDLQAADSLYRQILSLLRESGRERTADAVNIYSSWGAVKSDAGDIRGAVQLIESALQVGRALRPDELPDQLVSVNYAKRLVVLHRLDEAEQYLSRAREVAAREGDLDLEAISLLATVAAKRERGDMEAAEAALNAATSFVRGHFPADHLASSGLVLETGLTRLAAGSLTEAKAALMQASARYSRAKVHVTNEVQTLAALARVELGLGDLQAAAAYANKARDIANRFAIPGDPSYWVGSCLLVQAQVDSALHRPESARDLAARAMAQLIPAIGKDHPLVREAAGITGR